jgi:four helix bundle protein
MDLVVKTYQLCHQGPLSKDWGMRNQMQRAVVSIPANIAEGYERNSRKEYVHFLTISKGSSGELRCLLMVAERLGLIEREVATDAIKDAIQVSRMLKGLIDSLKT